MGPPYPPTTAQVGGIPSPLPDIPISATLLGLFLAGAAANMAVFQRNRRRRYKFLFSALVFGFCMARVVALAMRIAWACRPRSVRVALASQVFTAAGVLILFVTNLAFAQRIVRARHPLFGWRGWVTGLFRAGFASAAAVLVVVVTVTVQSFFVGPRDRDRGRGRVREVDRTVQLVCATYLAVYAFLPVLVVALALAVPRRTRIDKFGEGHFRTKVVLLTAAAALLAAGAVFRAVTGFVRRPVGDPAWFHGRACYYCFNFGVELVVVFTYTLARFDKRFHVPDGSSAPGHYSCADFGPEAAAVAVAASTAELEKMKRAYFSGGMRRGEAGGAANPESCSRSMQSIASGGKSERSSFGEGPSVRDSFARDADLAWMARAMRELYGDDDGEQKQGYV
ncbi:Family c-likeg-protein-coupled receptor protein [Madurella fahalii]|uniref:Family c-likeg-protein-coupled receptor protein n=1 Tax=Madurella fahalii TaxID=1157608 RepID=A0ABQ0GMY9_9PEZI